MIIRKAIITNEGFPYADSFAIDYLLTLTQKDDGGELKTHMKGEFRVNILKPIRFL